MKIFTVFAGLLAAFLITACGKNDENYFDSYLQGTWKSNDPTIYSGTLIINYDLITINGYSADQTPPRWDDNDRPFKGFTKGAALKGYSVAVTKKNKNKDSEEGIFYIEDGGQAREIPYIYYWNNNSPPDNRTIRFLRFTFGEREEILENSENTAENED